MKFKNKIYWLLIATTFISINAHAAMIDYISPAEPNHQETIQNTVPSKLIPQNNTQKARLTRNDIANHYEIAMQRFMQTNVKSSYMDFKLLIKNIVPNDFAYLRIADKMAEIGLFNLSNNAINKTYDKNISSALSEDIKKFYFPKVFLKDEEEIYLAEIYSNIMYNAQGKEASTELLKNTELLGKSDYANYIAALGLSKTGDSKSAQTYIDKALDMNPNNVNYQKLKIEIAFQNEQSNDALKVLKRIKAQKFNTTEYINKINTLEKYTLYKAETNDTMKKYYLGYYYYTIGENVKAIRTLQSAITSKKKYNRIVYALMSEVYYNQKEFEKAENFAEKSLQLGGKNEQALGVLGKINYRKKNYENAIKYFKSAARSENSEPLVWLAKTYLTQNKTSQALNIYYKILKDSSICCDAYYNVAIQEKDRENEYYKKSVSIDLKYIEGWLGLAKVAIENNNLHIANKYLDVAKYIDENDFRYYYYQGLVFKAKGMTQDAIFYFKKSLAINPDNISAKKELGIL